MLTKFAHSEQHFNAHVRCQRDDIVAVLSHTANMSPFAANLRAARKVKGWTLDRLAAEADTSKGYLSELERGIRPVPPGKFVDNLAAALDTTAAALTGETSDDRIRRTVPIVGYVGAGAQAHFYATGDGELDRVEAPDYATEKTVAAAIRGESLGPLLEHFLVFWDDVRSPVTEDLYHQLCVVGLPDDRILVKMIKPAGAPGRFHLLSNNEGPMLDEEIVWAAKVTGMRPR